MGSVAKANIVGFLCRICMELQKTVLHVFGDQGRRLQLAQKIAAYMTVKISRVDCLPKTVCLSCVERVEMGFAKLSTSVREKAITSLESDESMAVFHSDTHLNRNEILEWHVFTTSLEPDTTINVAMANGSPQRRRVFAFISPAADRNERNFPRRQANETQSHTIW